MAAKTYRFTLRLDEEQEKFVKEVADRLDMPPESLKALNQFTEQIRRIGVNLNGATRTLFRMERQFEKTDYRLSRELDPNTLLAVADDLEAMAKDVAQIVERTCRSRR